jgi:hypothetical protein
MRRKDRLTDSLKCVKYDVEHYRAHPSQKFGAKARNRRTWLRPDSGKRRSAPPAIRGLPSRTPVALLTPKLLTQDSSRAVISLIALTSCTPGPQAAGEQSVGTINRPR